MPKATVNEDRHLRWAEHDVGSTPHPLDRWPVDSVPEPAPVELAPQREFRSRVAPSLPLEPVTDGIVLGRRGSGTHQAFLADADWTG